MREKITCCSILYLCLNLCGCMTYTAIDKARGEPEEDEDGKMVPTEKREPVYYILVPFAAAGDIVCSPFEVILFLDIKKVAN